MATTATASSGPANATGASSGASSSSNAFKDFMRRVSAPITLTSPLLNHRGHANSSAESIRKYENQLSSIDSYTTRVRHEFDAFDDKRIRFLIFVENNEGSRYVLFDSKARASRRPFPTSSSCSSISPTVSSPQTPATPKHLNQSEKAKVDTNMLIKMVFGSMPMVITNRNSMKVHSFKSENKIMLSNVFNYVHNSSSNSSSMAPPLDIDLSSSTHSATTTISNNTTTQQPSAAPHRRTSNVNIGESASVSRHSSKQSSIDKEDPLMGNQAPQANTTGIRFGSASSNPVPIIKNDITKFNHFNSSLNRNGTVKASSVTKSFASSLCSNSPTSSLPPAYNRQCSSSYSFGLVKRMKRSMSSSLRSNSNHELDQSLQTQSGMIYSLSSNDNLLTTSPPAPTTPGTKTSSKYLTKYKIGISLVFSPHFGTDDSIADANHHEAFFEFFFAHLPLIEYQLRELRSHVIPALPAIFGTSRNGVHLSKLLKFSHPEFDKIDRELDYFRCKFNMLYNSPRLREPAWLTVTNSSRTESPQCSTDARRSSFLSHLIHDLVYLDKKLNGPKQSRMFLNRLISTVLKHNLSWLNTVVPGSEHDSLSESSSLSSSSCTSPTASGSNHRLRKKRVNWTHQLERTNPYNPLWAQLGDLHGAIGDPLSLTRTVIVGENRELVTRILFVLSYFIRCSGNTYYDIKQAECDLDHLIASNGHQAAKTASNGLLKSIDAHNGDQREISVFELGTSPTIEDHLSPLRQLHVNNESSPHISLYRNIEMLSIQVKPPHQCSGTATTGTTNTDTSMSPLVFSPTVHNGGPYSPSSPDIMSMNDDARLKSPGVKPPRFSQNGVKHRQISSNSLGEHCNAMSLPLIGYQMELNEAKATRHEENFGYSLLAGFCEKFVFEYVLHGTSDLSFLPHLGEMLRFSKENSILDAPIDEAMYIVANVDTWEIKVYSSESDIASIEPNIGIVDSIVRSVCKMSELFTNTDFILLHIEDKLQEIYFQALALASIRSRMPHAEATVIKQLMGIYDNDLAFLDKIVNAIVQPKSHLTDY